MIQIAFFLGPTGEIFKRKIVIFLMGTSVLNFNYLAYRLKLFFFNKILGTEFLLHYTGAKIKESRKKGKISDTLLCS